MILEIRVNRVWFGEPSRTQSWRGDVTLYFVSSQMSGRDSGFTGDDGLIHHTRRRILWFHGVGP